MGIQIRRSGGKGKEIEKGVEGEKWGRGGGKKAGGEKGDLLLLLLFCGRECRRYRRKEMFAIIMYSMILILQLESQRE